jgi:hypothetical protein
MSMSTPTLVTVPSLPGLSVGPLLDLIAGSAPRELAFEEELGARIGIACVAARWIPPDTTY